MKPLTLTPVTEAHSELLWQWANDPDTRAASFQSEPIPWETHTLWLAGRLADSGCVFYLARDDTGAPVGQIRFQVQDGRAVVSVSVAPERRGEGWGAALIESGVRALCATLPVAAVDAYVKPDNIASLRAFQRAGFTVSENTTVHGRPAVRLERKV